MDPAAHRRFLEYLEKYQYFGGRDVPRLSREDWLLYDAELSALAAKGEESLTADELARRSVLRRLVLLR